jgi:hypothetical protein
MGTQPMADDPEALAEVDKAISANPLAFSVVPAPRPSGLDIEPHATPWSAFRAYRPARRTPITWVDNHSGTPSDR